MVVSMLMLITSDIQAQVPIAPGTFTVNGKTFLVKLRTNPIFNGAVPNYLTIYLQSGLMNNYPTVRTTPLPSADCTSSVHNDFENHKSDFVKFYDVLRNVFSDARCNAIMNHDNEGPTFFVFDVTADGVVQDLTISITLNSLVTPQEIEALYTQLLAQMKFTTSPINCPSTAGFYFHVDPHNLKWIHNHSHYFGNSKYWIDRP